MGGKGGCSSYLEAAVRYERIALPSVGLFTHWWSWTRALPKPRGRKAEPRWCDGASRPTLAAYIQVGVAGGPGSGVDHRAQAGLRGGAGRTVQPAAALWRAERVLRARGACCAQCGSMQARCAARRRRPFVCLVLKSFALLTFFYCIDHSMPVDSDEEYAKCRTYVPYCKD